jgi:hypothetical protein
MLKSKLTIASLLAAAALSPAIAAASPPVQVTLGERAIIFNDAPGTKSRAEVRADLASTNANPVAVDGWRYVGGEAGWVLESPKFEFVDGQLVHAEDCAVKPTLARAEERLKGGEESPSYTGA